MEKLLSTKFSINIKLRKSLSANITNKETYDPFTDWIKTTFGKNDILFNNTERNFRRRELQITSGSR